MKTFRNLEGDMFTIVCNKDELDMIENGLFKVYLTFNERARKNESEILKIVDREIAERAHKYCDDINDIERG